MTATAPVRTVQTERQFTNWRHYPAAVNKPAARIFAYSLAASFGLFESLALAILWARDASSRDALYWYAIAACLALAVGGFTGWRTFVLLHDDYLDLSERRESTTQTDHGLLTEQARGIPLNEADRIIIRRPAKRVGGVLFQGAWLERMYAALQDGNQRFTRDVTYQTNPDGTKTGGIGGSNYGPAWQALLEASFIDEAGDYTEAGKRWLSTK